MPQTVDVLIDQLQLSIEELADRCGLPRERVEAIVTGRWTPSLVDRQQIADALNIGIDAISWGHTMNPRNVRYRRSGLPEHLADS